MGTGDYFCVTVFGWEPWGFSLRQGEGDDAHKPLHVFQVAEEGHAARAGVCEGDEVVSLNGEPCAGLTLQQASALIDASTDRLRLLLKRSRSSTARDYESEDAFDGERASSSEAFASTTLRVLSPHRAQAPGDPRNERAGHEEADGSTESAKAHQSRHARLSDGGPLFLKKRDGGDEPRESFSPLAMVEFQVSLGGATLDTGYTSLGSARGIEGVLQPREFTQTLRSTGELSKFEFSKTRESLGQHGVVLKYPSALEQVDIDLRRAAEVKAGGGFQALGEGVSAQRTSGRIGTPEEGEEVREHSFTVSFGIPSEGVVPVEERDSDSERDQDKPSKHRAKHARLRRSESLSEKQVKEAKSKCKRIALLLSAAPPNPNNKGVLMFKRHRQRAKKYTLVSYGTGGNEPEFEDDEKEAVEFTLIATSESELDEDFFTDAHAEGSVLTFDWDKGLLEIERKLSVKEEMENLADTKGKGALMFAQRRMRVDEITAEHEELRRQGIAVESVQEAEKLSAYHKMEEHSYMQATTERQTYMDVNMHQQSQHHHQQQQQQQLQQQQQQQPPQQQYQPYQEQQYYEQQQQYQQQYQQQQQFQQHYQQQQYEQQQQYHQQQMHNHQQEYQQPQQPIQQYTANMNGRDKEQTNETESFAMSNRSAKPFSVQDVVAPSSLSMGGTSNDAMGQGEQIASRDERISTPAIKTGILQDTRRRNTGMFSFKEAPKVSPNPALLNLLNRSEKKLGGESGAEEDYLSLGAEACNFLQSSQVKHKNPPPVAPKPMINPKSPPWAQLDSANQNLSQRDENSVSAPAPAPTTVSEPALEPEPTPAPVAEPSPPPPPTEAPTNPSPQEQHTWGPAEPNVQQQLQPATSWEGNGPVQHPLQPEPPVNTWAPAQDQPLAPARQTPPQLPWVTHQQQPQPKPVPNQNAWTPASTQPQVQPPWPQPQEQQPPSQQQTGWPRAQEQQSQQPVQPTWVQPQEQPQQQVQPPWVQPQERPPQQIQPPWAQPQEQQPPQVQPPWAQPQEQQQQQQQPPQVQPPWAQPQEQQPPQVQPPWAQPQEQQPPQVQPPWAQPQEQQQQQQQQPPQVQPPWAQPQEQQQQPPQVQPPWVQPQEQQPPQVQPPWAQPQEQQQQPPQVQPPWAQPQEQVQPPWVQQAPLQSQPQPPWIQQQPQPQTWPHPQAQPQPPWIASPQPQPQQPSMNSWTSQPNQSQSQPPWVQPVPPQAPLNPWAPVPPQPQLQPQPQYNSWTQEQNQPHWGQPAPNQSLSQPNWQQPTSHEQQPNSAWASYQTQPQQPQAPGMNDRVPPSSTIPPHTPTPPPAVKRVNSYTLQERSSSPINPMASVLTPSATGSAFEMPAVKGKGAELFAKRLSRMEKFVVDSDTVQANKASRPTSPATVTPNSWKYSPNVRAPPPLSYNPILSPSYPPGAMKQPPPSSPLVKAKNKEKKKPAPKPLAVIDVMKHQPYQLDASLFTYGPAMEAAKPPLPKPAPAPATAPPVQDQVIRYEQVAPVQMAGSMNPQYAQQPYGMPPQPPMHDGHYIQPQVNAYSAAPNNPYQQVPPGPYQPAYHPQYQQGPPVPYQPQPPNLVYQQPPQAPNQLAHSPPYQPAQSPPYQLAPTVPYQPVPPSTYVVPSFPVAARPDSLSGGSVAAAPKPKFMAKKSSGQVWRPTAVEQE